MARSVLATGLQAKFDRLSELSTREQAGLAQQTADDFGYHASDASLRHSTYRPETSNYLTGNQIVEALLKEAEPAVAAIAKPGEQTKMMSVLRLDRNLLELMAVRSRNLTGYANRKSQLASNDPKRSLPGCPREKPADQAGCLRRGQSARDQIASTRPMPRSRKDPFNPAAMAGRALLGYQPC
jgi:hypothetical protein